MDAVQEKLNPWLGLPKRKQTEGRVTLIGLVEEYHYAHKPPVSRIVYLKCSSSQQLRIESYLIY